MKDSRERFSEAADAYRRWRPSYPKAMIDWTLELSGLTPPAKVVDVGCGTGISARLYAGRGFEVAGVDPNAEMLSHAAAEGGGPRYLRGEAAALGLPGSWADLAVSGQAFHWFDLEPTMRELRRVLKSGAWCAAFWNLRARTPFLEEYEELLVEFSEDYRRLRKATDVLRAIKASPAVAKSRLKQFESGQRLDREGFFGRVYSSSYVVHGVQRRAEFDAALNALFDRRGENGTVDYAYRTVCLCWTLR